MAWSFIPQFFYDFVGRILPGAITMALLSLCFRRIELAASIEDHIAFQERLSSTWVLPILVVAYVIGTLFTEIWVRCLSAPNKAVERDAVKECLEKHIKSQQWRGVPPYRNEPEALPPPYTMRDHISHVSEANFLRLLKLRAEQRFGQVVLIGLWLAIAGNAVWGVFALSLGLSGWTILQRFGLALALWLVAHWFGHRVETLQKYVANGTCALWLRSIDDMVEQREQSASRLGR
jgi:hypothetical protein